MDTINEIQETGKPIKKYIPRYANSVLGISEKHLKEIDGALVQLQNIADNILTLHSCLPLWHKANFLSEIQNIIKNAINTLNTINTIKEYNKCKNNQNIFERLKNDNKTIEQQLIHLYKKIFKKIKNDNFNNISFDNSEKERLLKLYRFMGIDTYTLEHLREKTLYMSNPQSFNDPFDCALFKKGMIRWSTDLQCLSTLTDSDHIRIKCFNAGINFNCSSNTDHGKLNLMMAHYAKNHAGIMIEYEFDNNIINDNVRFLEVNYIDNNKLLNGNNIPNGDLIFKDGLTIKQKAWEYEKEYRFAYWKDQDAPEKLLLKDLGLRISRIIFMLNTTRQDKDLVINNLNADIFKHQRRILDPHINSPQNLIKTHNSNKEIEILEMKVCEIDNHAQFKIEGQGIKVDSNTCLKVL